MNNFSFKDIAIKKDPNTTRIVDRFKPVVTLISPSYFSISDSIQRVNPINFSYNVTDQSDIRSCDLIINNNVAQTDFSIQKNVEQNFTQSLDNGIYLWQVSCTDASFYKNKGFSQKNIIIVDVP